MSASPSNRHVMEIGFPGGVAVSARFRGHEILTDQPSKAGGRDSAPPPFDLFLASIGTCAGFYALRFCQQRNLDTTGLGMSLEVVKDEQRKRVGRVRIVVEPPPGFPDKYRRALVRAIDQCAVKRHILEPPQFEVEVGARAGAATA